MSTSSKLPPAEALSLIEPVYLFGKTLLKSEDVAEQHATQWFMRVRHILAEIEGMSAQARFDIGTESNFEQDVRLSNLSGGHLDDKERWMQAIKECRMQAIGNTLSILDTQISILRARAKVTAPAPTGKNVFIGHGRDPAWRELDKFLDKDLHLEVVEFNSEPTAGRTIVDRLKEMLDSAGFAFLIMTAEDHVGQKNTRARQNVIHEIGLFQGRLGFVKAIILMEEGCAKFSNVDGLIYIPFPKGNIKAAFHEIQQKLVAAGFVKPIAP